MSAIRCAGKTKLGYLLVFRMQRLGTDGEERRQGLHVYICVPRDGGSDGSVRCADQISVRRKQLLLLQSLLLHSML